MRLKELRGLPVIDPTAARKVGTVHDYQVDPVSGRLAALDIDGVADSVTERILAARIRRVGSHAVILTPRGGATPGAPAEINERWLDGSTLTDLDVMGDDGNRIGRLADATFDQDSLEIQAYLLHANTFDRLIGRGKRIQPEKVQSCSRELMLCSSGRLKEQQASLTSVVAEEPTVGLRLPLKGEDRLPAPSFEQVPEGQPASIRSA